MTQDEKDEQTPKPAPKQTSGSRAASQSESDQSPSTSGEPKEGKDQNLGTIPSTTRTNRGDGGMGSEGGDTSGDSTP